MRVDVSVRSKISSSARARQLEGMFDVPRQEYSLLEWHGDVPFESSTWNVGLIVGPSGSGKSTVARHMFNEAVDFDFEWGKASVIDDFSRDYSMNDIANVCQAVGFNTIPAWLRPYRVLSTGEKFRVEIARRLLEQDDPIVMDEFTSVVDRQIAQIGSHAVQKYVRRNERKFIAISCHYDIIEWLQPDWILEPQTMTFERRSVQRRPDLDITISPVPYTLWETFAPFHYLTKELNKAAQCFGLFVDDRVASFAGVLHRPHARVRDIKGISRIVTLPDWQGLGLAFVLMDTLGAAYKALNYRLNMYPAHPPFIRSMDRSKNWGMIKKPGTFNARQGKTHTIGEWKTGVRPSATFQYIGDAMNESDAQRLIRG